MDDSGIQHKRAPLAPSGFGFDDGGQRVPVTVPGREDDGDLTRNDSPCADRLEILRGLIALLTHGATALQTGQRMHLLAYLLDVSSYKTQAALAAELNVSPGRVSQIARELPAELARLADLKSRTAKARGVGRKAN